MIGARDSEVNAATGASRVGARSAGSCYNGGRQMPRPLRRIALFLAVVSALLSMTGLAAARLVVGQVVVDGNTKTTLRVLQARMGLRPGDEVDFEKLASAERRLIESDLFTKAHVYIAMPREEAARKMYADDTDSSVDVHVLVTEKTSYFVVPTASFGSGDYAAGVAYGDQNLAGHDLQLVGAAQIGQSKSYVFAGFGDPLVVGAPLTWGVTGLYRHEKIRYFADHQRILEVPTVVGGAEADIGWVVTPHLRALAGFSARSQLVKPAVVVVPDAVLPAYNAGNGRIFLLVFQIRYDDTIAPEGIRKGVRIGLKNEIGDRYWGSQFDYSKFEVHTEFYGQVGWNYPSLIFGTVFDFPTSNRGVPITEMLRIGGSNLRGFLVNEFHGDTLFSTQIEDQAVILSGIPLPLVDTRFNVALALFVDSAVLLERHPAGTTLDLPAPRREKLSDIHTGVGGGFRIILPGVAIPALKADVGYGIDVHAFAVTVSIAGGG